MGMSEPTNAPRVWLRWTLALALATGAVVGSIVPALGQEDPAEEAQPAAEAPPEESQFQEAVEAALVAETTEAPVEEAPPAEAPPEEAPPAEAPPTEEPVADAPVQEAATDQTPYYDPAVGNANLSNPAAQEALGTTDGDAVPPDGGGDEGSTGDDGSGGGQGEPATADGSSSETAPEDTAQAEPEQPEEQVDEPLDFSEQVSATLGADVTLNDSATPDDSEGNTGTAGADAGTEDAAGDGGGSGNEVDAGSSGTDDQVTSSGTNRAADDETQLAQAANSADGGSNANESDLTATQSDSTAVADGSGGSNNAAAEAKADTNRDGKVSAEERQRAERQASERADARNGSGGNDQHHLGLMATRLASLNNRFFGGDTAAAGNGGRANASADGGIVVIGTINSGGNQGNTINVDGVSGGYGECGVGSINGGNVDNSTNLTIDASGGTAIGDASGGSGNMGLTYGDYTVLAGNGGVTRSSADGGIVVINEINSGGNQGNTIGVGSMCGGGSINGGTVNNSTNIDIDASGGTAIADASGGDDNLAAASGDDDRGNGRRGGLRGLIQSRYGLGGRGGLAGRMASAGNGGRANASADGGIVVIGKINSGGNRGNTINVGGTGGGHGECSAGPVSIYGGDVDNSTNINIDAGGGTAIGDASGGSGNLAAVSGNDGGGNGGGGNGGGLKNLIQSRYGLGGSGNGDTASAGNGGIAGASADGGLVVINEINSGGNQGNTIEVGDICAAPVFVPEKPAKPGKPGKPGKTIKTPSGKPAKGGRGGKVRVMKVPSTGVGHLPTSPAPVTSLPFAVLPARRKDEEGMPREDRRSS
jgi:hypothetical protein